MFALESMAHRLSRLSSETGSPARACPRGSSGRRRIREQAAETITAAALSLGGSVGTTVVLWLALRWLA
jgi:hypothetical protein